MGDWLVHHELERQSRWRGEDPAIRFEGDTYTYADLNRRVNRLARALHADGVGPGETLLAAGRNHVDYLTLYFACSKLGATFSTVTTFQSARNVEHIVETLEPVYVFHTADEEILAETLPPVRAAAPDATLVDLDDAAGTPGEPLSTLLVGRDSSVPPWAGDHPERTEHCVFWTSGTTGRPKGVVRDHRAVLRFPDPLLEVMPHLPGHTRLLSNDMMFPAAYLQCLMPTIQAGGTSFVVRRFSPETVYRTIESHDVDVMLMGFTESKLLTEYLDQRNLSITVPYVHAVVPSASTATKLASLSEELYHFYATTETGLALATRLEPPFEGQPTLGLPGRSADARLKGSDDGGTIVPSYEPGDHGELSVRGETTMTRYLDERNQRANVRDCWVNSGDEFRVNDDGELVFVGRVDNRLRSGGVNVYPEEVESTLRAHDGVKEVVVVGVPDEQWGDRICALVVPENPQAKDLVGVLDRFCRESETLSDALRPKDYAFVDSVTAIPTGALEKWDRDAIGQRFFGSV